MISYEWRKSTFSSDQDCVEVRISETDRIDMRDSKNPTGPQLHFSTSEWETLIRKVAH